MKRRQLLGLLLLITGILLIAWPVFTAHQKQTAADELKQRWTQNLKAVAAKETAAPVATNGSGLLTIPSIDFEQVILEGASTKILDQSIGHLKQTGAPGKDNYALAGHRSFTKGLHFNRLPELKEGAHVTVTTKSHRYTYKMTASKLVKPTDVSVLNQNVKQATITLITCDPPETATNRLIKQGVLIKTESR
ncbi:MULTISPECIES: class D sortase [Exiguobacterium]|uniref:class D sortase n=1 Tax=Exiguobacterium TaxID=33986 RepID=UPI00047D8414|nr:MULTISPECIES: class D sortase [Exiguobacterium]MCT4780268.1 class D sortase [Exiguobacterium soli]OIN66325.1 sortase [Exiguobacterium sp. KRL4]